MAWFAMEDRIQLTDEDLARPAKELPLKVIRGLGQQLHCHLNAGGNWEILAEELGYEYEDIKRFNSSANIRQDVTPGELLLRDWVGQRSNGHTLFVLHDALCKADRYDCVEYMEREIFNNVICMDLIVCVKDETCIGSTNHMRVRTRANASILDSLQNMLLQPPQAHYKLLDPGASWTRTMAKEYKGRQLMLRKTTGPVNIFLDQDPTIDSSSGSETMVTNEHRPCVRNLIQTNTERTKKGLLQLDPSMHLHTNQDISGINTVIRSTSGNVCEKSGCESGLPGISPGLQNSMHCSSCICERTLQNNLNQAVRMQSNKQFFCKGMNIQSAEGKVHNLSRNQILDAVGHGSMEGISSKIMEGGRKVVNTRVGNSGYINEDMMTDTEYQDNFEDIEEGTENRFGQEPERMVQVSDQSLVLPKQILQEKNIGSDRDSSMLTDSSESDKEFVDQKMSSDDIRAMENTRFKQLVSVRNSSITHEKYSDCETQMKQVLMTSDVEAPFYEKESCHLSENQSRDPTQCKTTLQTAQYWPGSETGCIHSQLRVQSAGGKFKVSQDDTDVFIKDEEGLAQNYRYIDFNDFAQASPNDDDPVYKDNESDNSVLREMQDSSGDGNALAMKSVSWTSEQHRSKKYLRASDKSNTSKHKEIRYQYESLQRHISCPSDFFGYEVSEETHLSVPTIADAFSSPVNEHQEIEFELWQEKDSSDKQEQVTAWKRGNGMKCYSLPAESSVPSTKPDRKPLRYTFAHGTKLQKHSLDFDVSDTVFYHEDAASRSVGGVEEPNARPSLPPPRPHIFGKSMSHPYKVVMGGRSNRSHIDGMFRSDSLFSFYNNTLKNDLGWSPRETENTIEKTMSDVVNEAGFYIMWYNRTKKNLMISVSNTGRNVHLRVRSKVLHDHLNFYIFVSHMFQDVRELLQHYLRHGFSLETIQGPVQDMEIKLRMKCPLVVQYEKRPAISV